MTSTTRSLAGIVALALAGTAAVAAAPSASANVQRDVRLTAAQHPRLIDRPGADKDVIRLTNVPGAKWTVSGAAEVAFPSGHATTEVPVTADTTVTLSAATGEEGVSWAVPTGTPTAWTFAPTDAAAPAVDPDTVKVTWGDLPGDRRDTVTLRKVEGIVWTVKTGDVTSTYDATAFGTKTEVAVRATETTTVTAALDGGYSLPEGKSLPTFTNSLTSTDTVAVSAAVLDELIAVGQNPNDAIKGYGKGAAVETVKIDGIPGVQFKVGSNRPVAVRGTQYLPVNQNDLRSTTKITVAVVAQRGYTVPDDYAKELDFKDGAEIHDEPVKNADVKATDKGGTANDMLTLTANPYFTWWVGQDAVVRGENTITYREMRPNRAGVIVVKPRFARGEATAKVYLMPVANRGFTATPEAGFVNEITFKNDPVVIPVANQGALAGTKVTYTPAAGVTQWTTRYAIPAVGTRKASTKSVNVRPTDIEALNATSMTIDFGADSAPDTTTRVARDYSLAAG